MGPAAAGLLVSAVLGVAPVKNVTSVNWISMSEIGEALPATGYIRTSNGTKAWWTGRTVGNNDSSIVKQTAGSTVSFGDSAAVAMASTLDGFTVAINARTAGSFSLVLSVGAAANAMAIAEFVSGKSNILFDVTGTSGAASKIRFAQDVLATITQDTVAFQNNGQTLTVSAQGAKVTGAGTGGALALASGAGDGAGSPGPVTISCGATQQVSILSLVWTVPTGTLFSCASPTYGGSSTIHVTMSTAAGTVALHGASGSAISLGSTAQDLIRFNIATAGAGSLTWDAANTSVTMSQAQSTAAAAGAKTLLQAQQGGSGGAGNFNGGICEMASGQKSGTGLKGSARLSLGVSPNNDIMVEAVETATGRRLLALCGIAAAADLGANTGDGIVSLAPATTYPTALPGAGNCVIAFDGTNKRLGFWIGQAAGGNAIEISGTVAAGATAGGGAALPATVVNFLNVWIGGTQRKIPYYAV